MDTGAEVAKRFYKELTDIQVHYYDYECSYRVLNFSIIMIFVIVIVFLTYGIIIIIIVMIIMNRLTIIIIILNFCLSLQYGRVEHEWSVIVE